MNMRTTLTLSAFMMVTVSAIALCQQAPAPAAHAQSLSVAPEAAGGSRSDTARRSPAAAPTPLVLRGGAVPTGLSSWYDYQSNGGSPGYIAVDPNDPNRIHTVIMDSQDNSSITAAGDARHVGYAISTDGGATWDHTDNITGSDPSLKLGYPYVRVSPSDGLPYIAAHGDVYSIGSNLIAMYAPFAQGSLDFAFTAVTDETSATGRSDVIWPTFTWIRGQDSKALVIGSVYYSGTGEFPGPLQYTTADVSSGDAQPWADIGDSIVTNTSGGRYIAATADDGTIGVAYYRFRLDTSATENSLTGIYLTESTDNGATWSSPTKIVGYDFSYTDAGNINGDPDTLFPSANVDFVYNGNDPQIVFPANVNGLYASESIFHWSASHGLSRIATVDTTIGLGLIRAFATKTQPNMSWVSYPTISAGNDGNHLVVAFQAAAYLGDTVKGRSSDGFYYFRLWGVGSPDDGATWGDPFMIQDFGGGEGDSASIEYPAAAEHAVVDDLGNFGLRVTYDARRQPGMYSFTATNIDGNGTDADVGPFGPIFQYYQAMQVTPSMFVAAASSAPRTGPLTLSTSVRVTPNTASDRALVHYTVASAGTVAVRLFNAIGQPVREIESSQRAYPGGHECAVDLGDLPSGAYRVVVYHDGTTTSTPLNVVH